MKWATWGQKGDSGEGGMGGNDLKPSQKAKARPQKKEHQHVGAKLMCKTDLGLRSH